MLKSSSTKLIDGSLLVVIPASETAVFTVYAVVKAGPKFDPGNKDGLSHFTEHMLFKGTKKWPSTYDLMSAIEGRGASSQAFSYRETNEYWVIASLEDQDLAIINLLERLHNSLIRSNDVKTEKGVVDEERRMVYSNPNKLLWELWSEVVWPNDSLGRSYIGTEEITNSFRANEVKNFLSYYYIPENIIYVVHGNVNLDKVSKKFNSYLSKNVINNNAQLRRLGHKYEPKEGIRSKFHFLDTDSVNVAIGFPTIAFSHEDRLALELICNILAGGMSSRLRRRMADPGYTYAVNSYVENFMDTGYITVMFTSSRKNLDKCIRLVKEEYQFLKEHSINSSDLELAKGYMSGSLKTGIQSGYDWVKFYGLQYLYKRAEVEDIDGIIQRIDKIDIGIIKRISNLYFKDETMSLAIVGNIKANINSFL